MNIKFIPIGTVHTAARNLPRHWSVSHVEGTLEILPEYTGVFRTLPPTSALWCCFIFTRVRRLYPNC